MHKLRQITHRLTRFIKYDYVLTIDSRSLLVKKILYVACFFWPFMLWFWPQPLKITSYIMYIFLRFKIGARNRLCVVFPWEPQHLVGDYMMRFRWTPTFGFLILYAIVSCGLNSTTYPPLLKIRSNVRWSIRQVSPYWTA